MEEATFAGGCFWCMEPVFANLKGVIEAKVGYTGGSTEFPTYDEVCRGETGHFEAIHIIFDESKVSFEQLLRTFFFNIDPTDPKGQFVDKGSQYLSAVFYHGVEQNEKALKVIESLKKERGFSSFATKLLPADTFYPAEEWHQQFYLKDPERYALYKKGSMREDRLRHLWGPNENCSNGACGI